METVTFPEKEVAEFIFENVIPLRVPHDHKPLSDDFNIKWTPTLIILDDGGMEHHRTVGFLTPEELMASVLLGIGKMYFDRDAFKEAVGMFKRVLGDFPDTGAAPEAMFVKAVAEFKLTKETAPLKEAYRLLSEKYPDSEWTKRALPYRLL